MDVIILMDSSYPLTVNGEVIFALTWRGETDESGVFLMIYKPIVVIFNWKIGKPICIRIII